MALAGTHIRFAVDQAQKLAVQNMDKYVIGTLYPDSRYMTKIDRIFTHPKDFQNWDLKSVDDFHRGWYMHLLCDKLQYQTFAIKFPEIYSTGPIGPGNDTWIALTAVKLLQDQNDIKQFPIVKYLPSLDFLENPNAEDMQVLNDYYTAIVHTYDHPEKISIPEMEHNLQKGGLSPELSSRVVTKAEEYEKNTAMLNSIHDTYQEILSMVPEKL